MNTFDIHIEISPILKELGKLELKSSSSNKILLKKEKQGQIFVPVSNTVDNIKLTNIRSFKTPKGKSSNILVTGIDMFNDGRIVMADQSLRNRLVIINQEDEFFKTIQLEDRCYDVAVMDKDTVATTLFLKNNIVIVDVNSSKVQRTIAIKHGCYGIISTGEQLVVSLWNKTIQFFDLSGNTFFSTLSTADISIHCSVLNDKLYYTTHSTDAVYSSDLKGEVRWKFDCQKSDYPLAITNDASGNIFVACWDSNQLVVVGHDGKESRVLLTKDDGLQKSRAIHYNCKTNTLVVCNLLGQCFQYKVTN
ncbi:uncharacterized protein LOC127720350 [Mytilus californianus]|uniref:uncharacterized protein LOC127720350 n=1 Tax=Mytilus californianus TaxID=6549 RepID=UPI0022484563|nr:uncharacterized protein LOC127720350 [Mytilus californianus]